jgi:hypothetical protein
MQVDLDLPEHTTDQAIEGMIHYATKESSEPHVQGLADQITVGIHPGDKRSQMFAILNWVRNNLTYVKDQEESRRLGFGGEDLELIKSPVAVLQTRRYDCDCIATLIASVMLALGIQPQFVVIGFGNGPEHVYARGLDDLSGQFVIVDPVSHPHEDQMVLDTQEFQVYDVLGGTGL